MTVKFFQQIPQEVSDAVQMFASQNNPSDEKAIGSFTRATGLTSLNSADRKQGSLEYLDRVQRILLHRASSVEVDMARMLKEQLGINEILTYAGTVSNEVDFYGVALLPSSAINLEVIEAGSGKPRNSFNTSQVVDTAARIIATMHTNGFVHGNFIIPHFIDTRTLEEHPLRLYGNTTVTRSTDSEKQEKDIMDFLTSLNMTTKERIEGFGQVYRNYYGRS